MISSKESQIPPSSIRNYSFVNNTYGAAINVVGVHIIFNNCLFKENSGFYGGALSINDANWPLPHINNCLFENNSVVYGGSIFIYGADPNITNSQFINNSAEYGGVLYIGNTYFHIDSSLFKSNSAQQGGAIYAYMTKQYCTIHF